jgi:hypothetical protein
MEYLTDHTNNFSETGEGCTLPPTTPRIGFQGRFQVFSSTFWGRKSHGFGADLLKKTPSKPRPGHYPLMKELGGNVTTRISAGTRLLAVCGFSMLILAEKC